MARPRKQTEHEDEKPVEKQAIQKPIRHDPRAVPGIWIQNASGRIVLVAEKQARLMIQNGEGKQVPEPNSKEQ